MSKSLHSMTGFGESSATITGWRLQVSCRSVNHRGLDVRVNSPGELRWLESYIMGLAREKLHRGRLEVRIDLEPATQDEATGFELIDEERFASVARKLSQLAEQNGLNTPISLGHMLAYRSYFERSREDLFSEDQAEQILPVIEDALAELIESRRKEGAGIAQDLLGHLAAFEACLNEVEALKENADDGLRTRLELRLEQTLAAFAVQEVDEGRVAQELAFVVERGDISEELQRARSHVERLREVIHLGDEAGKKLDFYLQEMIRESNTMGSKSQHGPLTDQVIEMKSLVEKMREQAANIE